MLKKARDGLVALLKDDSGQTMLEYVIIVAIVVLAGLAVFKVISNYIKTKRVAIEESLNNS